MGVAYVGPGKVEVQDIPYPVFQSPVTGKEIHHGVILKVVGELIPRKIFSERGGARCCVLCSRVPFFAWWHLASNICGSDQHMVRSRTTAPTGLILGHEITGTIVEVGRDVEFFSQGRPRVCAV